MKENAREPSAVLSCDKRQRRAGEKPDLGQVHMKANLRTIETRLLMVSETLQSYSFHFWLYIKQREKWKEGRSKGKEERRGQYRKEERKGGIGEVKGNLEGIF